MKITSFILLIFFQSNSSFSRNYLNIDSLKTSLDKQKTSEKTTDILNTLSQQYLYINIDSSIQYAAKAKKSAEQSHYKKGMADALFNYGKIYFLKEDLIKAMNVFIECEKLRTEMKDIKGQAEVKMEISDIYSNLNNNAKSLSILIETIKLNESINDTTKLAQSFINLGILYRAQGNFVQSSSYFNNSLALRKSIEDYAGIGNSYINLAINEMEQKIYDTALLYLDKALIYRIKSKEPIGISNVYQWIGEVYQSKKLYKEAIDYFFKSRVLRSSYIDQEGIEEIDLKIGEVYSQISNFEKSNYHYQLALKNYNESSQKSYSVKCYLAIAELYFNQKKYKEAENYLDTSLLIGIELNNVITLTKCYYQMYKLDSAKGNYQGALNLFKIYSAYSDSAKSIHNNKIITEQLMNFEFEKKSNQDKIAQEKKVAFQKLIRNILIGFLILAVLISIIIFLQRNRIKEEMKKSELERKRSDLLLLNILPEEVAEELKEKGSTDAKQFDEVTVMFTDFKGFSMISEKLSPKELVNEIHLCFKAFDEIVTKYNIEKIKTIGDSYMCVGGLPIQNETHATDVVNAALEIRDFMADRKSEIEGIQFEIRIGIHTGSVVAGIVGVKKFAYDIWGDTVNIASRMESSGEAGKVNISAGTYELIKNKFSCTYRGKIKAKNKGEIDMYFVERNIES